MERVGPVDIRTVGVVGCGQMGGGIAQVAAAAGYSVVVMDASPELLEKGLGRIRAQLNRDVEKGRLAADQRDALLSRIQSVTALDSFAPCDLVIEAIVENMAEKKRIFAALDTVVQPGAILASNTPSLSLTEIGTPTSPPQRVAGAHFFNPAPVLPLLGIVRTTSTSD